VSKDQKHILGELEKFHEGKLAEVRTKLAGHSKRDTEQELVGNETVNVRIDPSRKELVVSWGK
jgi:hypothetical protein